MRSDLDLVLEDDRGEESDSFDYRIGKNQITERISERKQGRTERELFTDTSPWSRVERKDCDNFTPAQSTCSARTKRELNSQDFICSLEFSFLRNLSGLNSFGESQSSE